MWNKINETFDDFHKWEARKEIQPILQTEELKVHTEILEESMTLTKENVEATKQVIEATKCIAEFTKKNQESSKVQFIASIIVSSIALIIALYSFFYSIESSQTSSHLLEKQIKNQELIIKFLSGKNK